MLLFTPRWDQNGTSVKAGLGQTLALYEAPVGELPDISTPDVRYMVIGPSLRAGSTLWNASSGFGLRGSRPIVLNVPGDDASEPGDYVFIRFFGNFDTHTLQRSNNLAILLRTRRLRDIHARTDWDTPGGWRVDKHPRLLGNLTADGRADIVGFGDAGVWTALSKPDGTFADPHLVLPDFGYVAGGWRVDKHPRLLADLTGNGWADIIGFGDAGVVVALSKGDGTFSYDPMPKIPDFGYEAGGWRVDRHPRFLADLTGNGWADIVGFGDDGVYVALSKGDGTFTYDPVPKIRDFGYVAGGWRVDKHPRFLADLTGNGCADIIGFGDAGVYVALSNGDGTFTQPALFVIPNFGYRDSGPVEQQGPFLPDPDIGLVQASGGHSGTVFYVGGDPNSQLWKWTDGMASWQQLVPGGGARLARRFFVNPYVPSLVYLLDAGHVMRSDDGGLSWNVDASLEKQLTCNGLIPAARLEGADGQGDNLDVILTDMQFDPFNPGRRFAVGLAGAFCTLDGVNWERLLDTGALRGRPANCYFDWISEPSDPALYVSMAGRSILKISGLTPLDTRPANIRTRDGQLGRSHAMPDDRLLIVLTDGRSFVIDASRLEPQADGTYLIT